MSDTRIIHGSRTINIQEDGKLIGRILETENKTRAFAQGSARDFSNPGEAILWVHDQNRNLNALKGLFTTFEPQLQVAY
jgi:hypothetical protein